jgi:hypothetical protein
VIDLARLARLGPLLLPLCVIAVAGCRRGATQLVPVVRSDLAPEQRRCVLAEAGPVVVGESFRATATSLFYVEDTGSPRVTIPFSFGLSPPGGDPASRVALRVSALSSCADPDDLDARTVTRTVRSGFVRDQSIALPIQLSSSCVGVVCPDTQTCEDAVCVAIPDIDPQTLTPVTPGSELGDAGVASDAGAGGVDAGTTSPTGTLPATLSPQWGLSSGTMFDYPGRLSLIGLAGEDAIVAGTTELGGTFAGTAFPASTVLIARVRPDGTTRWIHPLSTAATGLDLQSFGAYSAVLAAPGGTPRLFVCGSVAEGGLTDADTGTRWDARETGTFAPSDAWFASFDPDTGALGRVTTLHSLSSGDVSTSCRPFSTNGRDVRLVVGSYNTFGTVTSIEHDGGSIPLPGALVSGFSTILAIDPAFDEGPAGVFATLLGVFPGAGQFHVASDGAGGLVVAGSGTDEPGAPLAAGAPRTEPTLVVARLAADGSVTWRNRILGSRVYVNVHGFAVSAGRVTVSAQSTGSMTSGPYQLQVGETGMMETLPWTGDALGRATVTLASFDLRDGSLLASSRLPENSWHRIELADADGDCLVLGELYAGDDVGFGPYTPMGDADMSLLRLSSALTIEQHLEWTSDGMTRDELGPALLTPGGVLYVAGSTALDATATLSAGIVVRGEFLTRL